MKILSLFIFVFSILGLNSCKYECEGFPDSELIWIPYSIGDTLYYSDNVDTISMIVEDYFLSPFSSSRGLWMDYRCEYNGYYQTSKEDFNYQIKEEITDSYNGGMKISITKNDFFRFNIWNKTTYSDTVSVRFYADTLINSMSYSELFLVSKDTVHQSPRIAWILKAKDKGIIEFYDYNLKRKWRLIDN
jgi:hypothetical protein